ncbi:PspA/IM30 family protein [Pseudomonas putida]|uniref:PspA/IM30 family protein n=1 Tax=Pseudomonas putida TaxID=303 RepID=A0A8I1JM62_PSEPU|nr:PspA/IM30 family protein [Pseudomonas putida]MBI6885160.1 PspA/IM30 family protein [Pseudomonas putida]
MSAKPSVWKKLFTALRGGANEVGEALVDVNAMRILDQEIRDASADQEKAKEALTGILAKKKLQQDSIDRLNADIADLSAKALKADQAGKKELALEIAQAVGAKAQQRDAEQKMLDQYSTFAEKQKGIVTQTEGRINQARQQAELAKARSQIQSAQQNVLSASGATSGGLNNAMDSLERIRNQQNEIDARMAAREELENETSGQSLENKMKEAGLVDDQYSAANILAGLQKKDA